jgi:hypothetical protein
MVTAGPASGCLLLVLLWHMVMVSCEVYSVTLTRLGFRSSMLMPIREGDEGSATGRRGIRPPCNGWHAEERP